MVLKLMNVPTQKNSASTPTSHHIEKLTHNGSQNKMQDLKL